MTTIYNLEAYRELAATQRQLDELVKAVKWSADALSTAGAWDHEGRGKALSEVVRHHARLLNQALNKVVVG